MITNKTIAGRLAAFALAVSLGAGLSAQTGVTVEESTGTATRTSENEVIDIRLGTSEAKPKIVIETPSETPKLVAPQERIELTPDEFKGHATDDAQTTTAEENQGRKKETDVPAGIPVPTDTGSVTEARNKVTSEPVAIETKSHNELMEDEPVVTETDSIDFLPSSNLGKEAIMTRNGEAIPLRPETLTSAPLTVTVPAVSEITLTNGIRFYHYPSHDLPRIQVRLLIEAGGNSEPADKVGLAELTERTLRAGGAAGKSGDDIDRDLDQIGSELELKIEREAVSGQLFALTEKSDEAMALLAAILTKPEFDEKKLEQQKQVMLETLRRQNDEPDEISRREFRKIIYGHDHPLARTPTSATISALGRDDVRAFYDARYRPSTLWIGISGDITQEDARKLVEKHLGDWNRPEAEPQPALTYAADSDSSSGVYLTRKPTAQSQIRMGHFGIPRMSPQAPAVNVMNSIYGTGGFSSRLMNKVRTEHGYVYGVGGGIFSDDPVGMFTGAAASQSKTTVAAIKEMIAVTKSLTENPPGPEEMEVARRDIFFTFVNQFATPASTLSTHMIHDYRGYPEDYLKTFPEKVKAVTQADVIQAAKDFLHLDRLKIYVIGNENELDAPLNQFGEVTEWKVE